jgi:CheY-like chemotaxis protein
VVASRDASHASIAIADSGEGIRPEFLPHVFDRFSQGASSRKQHGGLGIGLAIARHLVELHGGSVEAESEGEGRGAVFKVRLPLRTWRGAADVADPRADVAPPAAARVRARSLEGLRIMTVDDDRNTREMLREVLQRAGAQVATAESARDALEKLASFRPDLLVSDIGMPTEDGYDLLRQIRALGPAAGGAIPAVALTGYAREEDRLRTWRAGYQAVMPKPVNLEELLSTLAALGRRTRH